MGMEDMTTVGYTLNRGFNAFNNTKEDVIPVPVLAKSYLIYKIGELSLPLYT